MNRAIAFFRGRPELVAMLGFLVVFYVGAAALQMLGKPLQVGAVVAGAEKNARMQPAEVQELETRFREGLMGNPELMRRFGMALFAVLSAGLFIDAFLLFRKARGAPLLPDETDRSPVPWGLGDVFTMFVFLIFFEAAFLLLEVGAFALMRREFANRDLLIMVNSLARDVVVVFVLLYALKKRYGVPPGQVGFTTRALGKNALRGLMGYLAIIPPLVFVVFIVSVASRLASYEPPPQPVVEMYLREGRQTALVFFTVFVAVLGPVMEELFFRGFAYKAFRARFGVSKALVISSLLFSLLHASVVAFLPIFLLGLFLAYLYERTGSLVPGIAAHMTHNLIMVACTLTFKSLAGA